MATFIEVYNQPIDYQETSHVLETKGFLANPARTLDILMADDDPGTPSTDVAKS